MSVPSKQFKRTGVPIQIARWAEPNTSESLSIPSGPRQYRMFKSDATGSPLLKEGKFGADVIRFGPREGVANHVHEGAHILFVLKGTGWVVYEGVDHELEPGLCYFVPSWVEHAIRADTELILIAVGNDHRPVDSSERLVPVEDPN
jgi:quercetin dioxygenase-like cupin family protein